MTSDIILDDEEISLVGKWFWGKRNENDPGTLGLSPDRGMVNAGGHGTNGSINLFNEENLVRVHIDSGAGTLEEEHSIYLDGYYGNLIVGGGGQEGDLILRDTENVERIQLDSGSGAPVKWEQVRVYLNGKDSDILLGGDGQDGDIVIQDKEDINRIHLDGGGDYVDPHVRVYLNGMDGSIQLGGDGRDGSMILYNVDGEEQVHLDAERGDIKVGPIESLVEKIQTLEQEIAELKREPAPAGGGD